MKQHTVHSDSKGRLNLGLQFASSYFLIEEKNDGEIILRKAAVIPENELWLHKNKEALESLIRGLDQARSGKVKKNAIDLDTYV